MLGAGDPHVLLEPQITDGALDGGSFRSVSDQQGAHRNSVLAHPRHGLEQVAVRLFGPQRGAQAHDVVRALESQRPPRSNGCVGAWSRVGVETFGVHSVVNHGLRDRPQAVAMPVAPLVLADVDEQIAPADEPSIQQHLHLFLVGHQQHRVEDGDQPGPGLASGASENPVQHRVHVGADDDIDAARCDELLELAHGLALHSAAHIAAHDRIEPGAIQLRQQRLAALQVREVQPKAARVDTVEQADDLFLGAADIQ